MIRNDTNDITDCELQNITDKKVLLREYDHINILLQEKEKIVNNFILLLFTGISILGWSFLKNEIILSNLFYPFILILSLIFIFQVIIVHINRSKLIRRKSLIVMCMKKCEKES